MTRPAPSQKCFQQQQQRQQEAADASALREHRVEGETLSLLNPQFQEGVMMITITMVLPAR